MKYVVLAATALAIVATPAMAQEEAAPLGGFHVSGVVGYDSTKATLSYEDTAFPADNFEETGSSDGVLYGVNAGYDFSFGSGTFGIEGAYETTDNERCEEIYGGDEGCISLKRNWYVGVKGSTLIASRTSLTAGVGYLNGKAKVTYVDPAFPGDNFTLSDNRDGFRLGLGLEQRFSGQFFGKLEYRYSNYKDYELTEGTETLSLGFERHQVVAGLGVRF